MDFGNTTVEHPSGPLWLTKISPKGLLLVNIIVCLLVPTLL
jgi:hypothetical protein